MERWRTVRTEQPFCRRDGTWRRLGRTLAGSCALLLAAMPICTAGPVPVVSKVEPPNWWMGHTISPVHVLLHGSHLAGARVQALGPGIRAGKIRVNAPGTYLFVDVFIAPRARPGRRALRVTTPQGRVDAPFEISAPLPRAGRFAGFTPDDVIYLILPDRFSDGDQSNDDPAKSRGLYDPNKTRYYHGGDFQGIINHLPYLKDLGVTALWLTPIYDNADVANQNVRWDGQPGIDYHGYGATDFYGVEEHFGTLAKLRELVDAAHRLGIKVIQDQVANHTGPLHPWVSDPPTPTWFHGTKAHHLANTWQVWTLMDPHAAPETQRATLNGWFADLLPDLNQDDPEEARYTIQNTLWWLGMAGFDAIRQDTLCYVPRRFWRGWTAAIKRQYPRMTVLGEVNLEDPALVSFFQGGRARFDGIDTGVDTLFDYPLYFALRHAFAEGKPLREVATVLAHDALYPRPDALVTFLDLHDVPRFLSVPGATADGYRLALTLLMTLRGTPMLYYGDEIGMRGAGDPDNRRDFPGGFPSSARNAFTPAGRTPEEQAIFAHVRRLTRLRTRWEPLRRGALANLYVAEQQYVYARRTARASVIVALNNDARPAAVQFSVAAARLPDGTALVDQLDPGRRWRVRGGGGASGAAGRRSICRRAARGF